MSAETALAAVHPELKGRHAWLPRGVGRRWMLPFQRLLFRVAGALSRSRGEWVDSVRGFVFWPEPPPTEPAPALLWLHGGGFVMGDARQDEAFLRRVVDELGVVVLSVQYRLAPDDPFPAALEDAEAGFRWLAEQPGVDPSRVAIGGGSAGGGLAASLGQRLRTSELRPVFQLLVYPMLDDRSAAEPGTRDGGFRLWDRASNAFGWSSYLAASGALAEYAVPARTVDLAGVPPAWIGVGTLDLFHDEVRGYAERLRDAGVDVDLEVVEGAYHGFDAVDPDTAVARRFHAEQLEALARHLSVAGATLGSPTTGGMDGR